MRELKNISLIILFSSIYFSPLFPQTTNLRFDHISLEQGLSQSTVYAITQDAQGFMWFGTQDGLNRYDGYSIIVFKHDPEDTNSISDNTIRCLLNDKNGNLWIGTEFNGLNRYVAGENKFYRYKFNEKDSTTISDNIISCLFESSDGNIWVGTHKKGLNLFHKETKSFTRISFADDLSVNGGSNTIWAIAEDSKHNLFIVTSNGLYTIKLNEKGIQNYHLKFRKSLIDSLTNNDLRTLTSDSKNNLWVGTWGSGLDCYKTLTNSLTNYSYSGKKSDLIPSNFIQFSYEDSKGNIWAASNNAGLFILNKNTKKFRKCLDEVGQTIFEDKSGIIWIGTLSNGIKIYDSRRNKFRHFYDDPENPNDLNGNVISAIYEDDDGELWIGTNGNGLNRFNPKDNKSINYTFDQTDPKSISDNFIRAVSQSSDGSIWVGTLRGLNRFDKKTGQFKRFKHDAMNDNSIDESQITTLYYDNQTNILWIGHFGGGIDCYNLSLNRFTHFNNDKKVLKTFSGKPVTKIYKGKKTGLWIGTYGGGLIQFNLNTQVMSTDNFERYRLFTKTRGSLNNDYIFSIYEDSNGIIWIGTKNGGLNRYDPATDSFKYFTIEKGLANDVVYGILPDNMGNLWLSTNSGISKFNIETGMCKNYDAKDGLQAKEFNEGAYFESPSGELFFGGINGFNAFFPKEVEDNNYIPPIYVTNFRVFDERLPLSNPIQTKSKIKLSYSQNFFIFEFVALNYTSPEKNQFEYILEGFDSDWHKVSSQQRYASYSNLDPGEYLLRVKGSNNDNLWNETGTSILLIISPPFWMTWWFWVIGSASVILFLSMLIRVKFKRIEKEKLAQKMFSQQLIERQETERQRIANELHDGVGHTLLILKNLLTMNLEEQQGNTQRLEDSIKTSAQVLEEIREISHNLRPSQIDQLGLTTALDTMIEHIAATTAIQFNVTLEPIDDLIPQECEICIFRIIQEGLNNIFKHAKATEVSICLQRKGEVVEVILEDNGMGISVDMLTKRKGFGITGMIERASILGGTLNVTERSGGGTTVKLKVPLSQKQIESFNVETN